MGRPAELVGPLKQQPQIAPLHISERGRKRVQHGETEMAGVEVDGGGDIVDHVADVDRRFIGHWRYLLGMRPVGRRAEGSVPPAPRRFAHVRACGGDADDQLGGDLFVAETAADQGQHFALAVGQDVEFWARGHGRAWPVLIPKG
jgi:hypothetical protein